MAENLEKDKMANVSKTLTRESDNPMEKLRKIFNSKDGFNAEIPLRTSDLIEMVHVVESLLVGSEKRFQHIKCKIVTIPKQSKNGIRSVEEIIKEFHDMKNEIHQIKCLISPKSKLFTENQIKNGADEGKENGCDKLQDRLKIYEPEETRPLEMIHNHLESLQHYKSINHLDTSSKELYKQITQFLQEIDDTNCKLDCRENDLE